MILLDTSGLFAALDQAEPMHQPAARTLETDRAPFVISPFVLQELDYLLLRELGQEAELALLSEVGRGAYELASFGPEDIRAAFEVIQRYRDLGIGLADASIVVLAGRYGTNRVLTFDERHFRALRTPQGDPFVVLPADNE